MNVLSRSAIYRLKGLVAVAVVLGPIGASALTSAGSLTAWGGGQVGFPAGLTNIVAISTAMDHTLALDSNGKVVAWGNNFDNQCEVPADLGPVIGVAAGAFFSTALKSNGTIAAWGDDQFSQTQVPVNATNVIAISAGRGHILALKSDTTVTAWGSDIYGQCDVPAGLSNVVAVLASWNYSLALRKDGTVVAWGVNDAGQTDVPAGLNGVTALSGNMEYCLALKSNGTVISWGKAPLQPDGLKNIVAIAAGQDYCLGLTTEGTLVTWGANNLGQTNIPPDIGKVGAVGAGWNYSVALLADGVAPTGFTLLNSIWQTGIFSLSISGQTNRTYSLQFKQTLADPGWTDLTAVQGSIQPVTLFDPAATNAHRFYRVREQ